jgi:hypothetical protein
VLSSNKPGEKERLEERKNQGNKRKGINISNLLMINYNKINKHGDE